MASRRRTIDISDQRTRDHIRVKVPATSDGSWPPGVTNKETLLKCGLNGAPSRTVGMEEVDFLSTPATTRQYTVKRAVPATLRTGQVSTRGEQIAWYGDYDSTPPFVRWLNDRIAWVPRRSGRAQGIWVSRLDGSNMREVGHVAAPPSRSYLDGIDSPQWLPGDRKLSLTYRGALYTVPVPQ